MARQAWGGGLEMSMRLMLAQISLEICVHVMRLDAAHITDHASGLGWRSCMGVSPWVVQANPNFCLGLN